MNKRQAKKKRRKEETFIASFANSYRELKELDKSYHEYVVWHERRMKKCFGCEHLIPNTNSCNRVLMFEPCAKGE